MDVMCTCTCPSMRGAVYSQAPLPVDHSDPQPGMKRRSSQEKHEKV